jgi:protein-glucosylgalactosylhydroxylysine glucosidase
MSLELGNDVYAALGQNVSAQWADIAANMYLPFDAVKQYHPEFDGYTVGTVVKQADVVLAGFPLGYPMPPSVRANDLQVRSQRNDSGK